MDGEALLSWLVRFYDSNPVISIHGHAHSGKTTFAITLANYVLITLERDKSSCVWFQASEHFPVKRLQSLYGSSLNKRFYIIPKGGVCLDYLSQKFIIQSIIKGTLLIPPDTKIIVIDNISHFLRFELQTFEDAKGRAAFLNTFFDDELFPLIMFCKREGIILVLIHEASFNINTGQVVRFFKSLYSRIDSLNINLINNFGKDVKTMEISYKAFKQQFHYKIYPSGLIPASS